MKIKHLISQLQQLDPNDLIQVSTYLPEREGKVFLKIDSVQDDTNVGVWNLIVQEFEEGQSVWETTAWD